MHCKYKNIQLLHNTETSITLFNNVEITEVYTLTINQIFTKMQPTNHQ